ncbi:MAG: hypothetical protein V4630_14375 [Pseudomonadota bacterium]|uniref:hypothetical protein n=1 Tax=Tabrizicola sp. TaxID=2005166 RepID=UPI0025D7FE4B|nr:hypothetical protein [Tabrizicola sp.]
MKSLIAAALSLTLAAGPLQAGGPVVVVEEPPVVVEEGAASSKGLLPWLMVPLVLCIVMCGPEEEAE